MKHLCFLMILMIMATSVANAQVGINADNSAPDPSAGLDVKFTDKGMLPPRMTADQRDAIANPAEGLMVYCTNCGVNGSLSLFTNGTWRTYTFCNTPSPLAGSNSVSPGQITWRWTAVAGASGYKWNTTNSFNSATDMGTETTKTETGLPCDTTYTRYVWAYSECGISAPIILTQTLACWTCGYPITVHHEAGLVAPVTKATTYGTVTNIPGERAKCWITSNLGSDHQATAVDDGTEASAGWYWQFNRKQGYKHDGSTRTPNTVWTSSISENSEWKIENDPCNIELGTTWHLPTSTEWYNVDNAGGWSTWNGPWGSGLKLHAAGCLYFGDGSLYDRGYYGHYPSSTQFDATDGWYLTFGSGYIFVLNYYKAYGFSVRCVRDH
jgi:hypothetical protein